MEWVCVCSAPCCGFSFLVKGAWQAQLETILSLGKFRSASQCFDPQKRKPMEMSHFSSDGEDEEQLKMYRNSAV